MYRRKKGKGLIRNLIYGRNDFSPKVKRILNIVGEEPIHSIEIQRIPLSKVLLLAFDALSFHKFSDNNPYDKLFHLRIVINNRFILEKNEVINMDTNIKKSNNTESLSVPIHHQLTTRLLLLHTYQRMGNDFFSYSVSNNCQKFIEELLIANGLSNQHNLHFVKQNTKDLFDDIGYVRRLANTITDVYGRVNVLTQGGTL